MSRQLHKKVFVGMSGGVDSSVVAALLKKATPNNFSKLFGRPTPKGFSGYDVTGVFFKPWSAPKNLSYCNWQEDRQDALRVCTKLGIPFKTWDFSKEYEKSVTQYMIDSYRAGITPNPDVMCNKEIKFGLFLKRALAEGADFIATGHYARVKCTTVDSGQWTVDRKNIKKLFTIHYSLFTGLDNNKDQSYFLYTLTQNELRYSLFPLGDYTKPEVRKLAKKFGLPNHAKRDSQGVCFVGQLNIKDFLKYYIQPKPGEIRLIPSRFNLETSLRLNLKDTPVIGQHDGVYYYTIGQRHGLNLGIAGGPYFVAKKDLKRNIIYVVTEKDKKLLGSRALKLHKITWVTKFSRSSLENLTVQVKIRYRTTAIPAKITSITKRKLTLEFRKPAVAVTSGQSAVIYKGTKVLGGGTII